MAEIFPFPSPFESAQVYVTGPNGYKQPENMQYYATQEVADWLATRYGGAVVEENMVMGGPYTTTDAARFIEFVGNGKTVTKNAGIWAQLFLSYPQSFDYVDQKIKAEIQAIIQD